MPVAFMLMSVVNPLAQGMRADVKCFWLKA
jgi:hypothetical protein